VALAAAAALCVLAFAPSAEAQMCPSGYRWSSWSRRCVPSCPSGYYYSYVSGRCRLRERDWRSCPSGYYWSYSLHRCKRYRRCPSGYFYSYRYARCRRLARTCPFGSYWNAYTRRCASRCPTGYRYTGTRCVRLASSCGYGYNWNGVRCVRICPSHTYYRGGRCVPRRPGGGLSVISSGHARMSSRSFRLMLDGVHRARFSSSKLTIIRAYARANYFSCYQVRRLLRAVRFSSDRVRALRALAPRIVDRHRAYTIPNVFRFSSDRRRARSILGL
jgi:hypothetical protein